MGRAWDDTSPDERAPWGAKAGPRDEAEGAVGTGREEREEGRGPEKKWATGESEVGRTGWVEEEAISESWLNPSAILVFSETGAGAGLSTWVEGWVSG